MISELKKLLSTAFTIDSLEVVDNTPFHAAHPGAQESGGAHFSIVIVSPDFVGLSSLQRHRDVHQALHAHWGAQIHALALKALTPDEYAASSSV